MALCDDWNDPALVTRAMQGMDAVIQSLVDRMSTHQKIATLAVAEGKTPGSGNSPR
jgi:hypothetical protein